MPRLPEGPDPRPLGGVLRPVSGRPEPAAEGRGPAGARRGDPGAARGGPGEAHGGPVMERRTFLVMASGSLLAAPLAAEAQQANKIARIGWLSGNMANNPQLPEAFRQGLRDLGYVEGRNVVIEYRDAGGNFERLPALAAELVALKVDVILAGGTPH